MLRIKKITEITGKNVFTSDGDYFGQVDDVNLAENKIECKNHSLLVAMLSSGHVAEI